MKGEKIGFWKTLKTTKGAWKLLAVCLAVIIVFSCIGALMAHSGTKVVIRNISFDKRGAVLTAELYTPRHVSAEDNLPAVLLAHGGGVSNGVMGGFAQELARRGFVVLNVNAYGAGTSENPPTDETGAAPGALWSPRGLHDAYEYLCSLEYVDKTRIAVGGHSMGNIRTGCVGAMDGCWMTLNDMLVNDLYEVFGIELTEEQIYEDADKLAEQYLNEDQMVYYTALKAEKEEIWNNRIKGVAGIGGGDKANRSMDIQTITVAGHEVQRMLNANVLMFNGRYDENNAEMSYFYDSAKYTSTEGILHAIAPYCQVASGRAEEGHVYATDTTMRTTDKGVDLGYFRDLSVTDDPVFAEAVKNTCLRGTLIVNETHSQNFLSTETTQNVVKFFEQTLGYNNGDLGDPSADPIPYTNNIWLWREVTSAIAMFAMWAMLFPMAVLLLNTPFFAEIVSEPAPARISKKDKGYWLMCLVYTLAAIFGVLYVGGIRDRSWSDILSPHPRILPRGWFLPFDVGPLRVLGWMLIVSIAIVICLVVNGLVNKKASLKAYLEDTKLKFPLAKICKTYLLALIIISISYIILEFINRVLFVDYRFWMAGYEILDPSRAFGGIRFMIVLLPLYLISGVFINSGRMTDMSEGKNTALNVFISVFGMLLVAIVMYAISVTCDIPTPCYFFCTNFAAVLLVPVTAYISRKMYNITGNVWLGAITNAMLISWLWASMTDTTQLMR